MSKRYFLAGQEYWYQSISVFTVEKTSQPSSARILSSLQKIKRPLAKKPLVASRNVSCFKARIYLVCAIQERVSSKLITSRG